jgi:hypothetical protein
VCVDTYDNGGTIINKQSVLDVAHELERLADDVVHVGPIHLRAVADKLRAAVAADHHESGGVDLNLGEPDYVADVDARTAVNIYQLRANYVDAFARLTAVLGAGEDYDDDAFVAVNNGRIDAARRLVAALDAARNVVT